MAGSTPLLSGIGQIIGGTGDLINRDIGHAQNAAYNLTTYGALHAPANAPQLSPGTQRIFAAQADPNNPGMVADFGALTANSVGTYHPSSNNNVQNSATINAAAQNPSGSANLTTTGAGAGGGFNMPSADQINQAYDLVKGQDQGMLGTLPARQQAATDLVNNQYGDQARTYLDQYNSGNANLDQQTKVLNDSYTRSLQQLGNNIRNQFQGTINALGIGGAGNSSAAQMAAYALANEQNTNRGYMNTDLNNQLSQIGIQRDSLGKAYNDEYSQLKDQYQANLQGISQQYNDLTQQINTDLARNEQARQMALAYAGQWAASQVQSVNAQINQAAQALDQKYSAIGQTPMQNLSYQPNYQASQITAPTVGAQQQTSQQVSPNAPLLAPGFNSNNNQNNSPLAVLPTLSSSDQRATNPAF